MGRILYKADGERSYPRSFTTAKAWPHASPAMGRAWFKVAVSSHTRGSTPFHVLSVERSSGILGADPAEDPSFEYEINDTILRARSDFEAIEDAVSCAVELREWLATVKPAEEKVIAGVKVTAIPVPSDPDDAAEAERESDAAARLAEHERALIESGDEIPF